MTDTRIGIKLDLNLSEFKANVETARQIVRSLGKDVGLQLNALTQSVQTLPASFTGMMTMMQKGFFNPVNAMLGKVTIQATEFFASLTGGAAELGSFHQRGIQSKGKKTKGRSNRNAQKKESSEAKSGGQSPTPVASAAAPQPLPYTVKIAPENLNQLGEVFNRELEKQRWGQSQSSIVHSGTASLAAQDNARVEATTFSDVTTPRKLSEIIPLDWYLENVPALWAKGAPKTVPDVPPGNERDALVQRYFDDLIAKVSEETEKLTNAITTVAEVLELAPGGGAAVNLAALSGRTMVRSESDFELVRIQKNASEASRGLEIDLSGISDKVALEREKLTQQSKADLEDTITDALIGKIGDIPKVKKIIDQLKKEVLESFPKGKFWEWLASEGADKAVDEIFRAGIVRTKSALDKLTEQGASSKTETPSPSVRATTRVHRKRPLPKRDAEELEEESGEEVRITLQEPRSAIPPSLSGDGSENNQTLENSPIRLGKEEDTIIPQVPESSAAHFDSMRQNSEEAEAIARDTSDRLLQIEGQYHIDKAQSQQEADREALAQQQHVLADREALLRNAYEKVSQFLSFGANASEVRSLENKRYRQQVSDFKGSLEERHDAKVTHEQKLNEIDEQAKQQRLDMVKNFLLQEVAEIAIQELAKLSIKATSETSQTAVQEAGTATRSGLAATESGSNLLSAASSVVSAIANAVRWVFTTIPFPFSLGVAGAAVAAVYGLWEGARGMMGFATGGHVQGPGTGTSDSIPARLSNNEFVVNASSVESIGVGTLDYLNTHGALPPNPTTPGPTFGLQRPLLSSTSVDNSGALLNKLDSLERTVSNLKLPLFDQNLNRLSQEQTRAIKKSHSY